LDRAILRLPSCSDDVEGAVSEALTRARQPQLRRVELQVAEVDNSVIPPLDVRSEPGQSARELTEKAVVEPANPRLGGADNMGTFVVRPRHDLETGYYTHDPEPRDQVPLHRTRQQNLEAPRHEIDEERQLAVPLCAGEPEILTAHELGRDRQPSFDPGIGEHRARDIADPADVPR